MQVRKPARETVMRTRTIIREQTRTLPAGKRDETPTTLLLLRLDRRNQKQIEYLMKDFGGDRIARYGRLRAYRFGGRGARAVSAAVQIGRRREGDIPFALVSVPLEGKTPSSAVTPKFCKRALNHPLLRIQQRLVRDAGAVIVPAETAAGLAGVRKLPAQPVGGHGPEPLVAVSPRRRDTRWSPAAWFKDVQEFSAQALADGHAVGGETCSSLAGDIFEKRRFELAVDMLVRLVCLSQNARHNLLSELRDVALKSALEYAAQCMRRGWWTDKIEGLAYGRAPGERSGDAPIGLQVLTSASAKTLPGASEAERRIDLPYLGRFLWQVEHVGELDAAAALHARPPHPGVALGHPSGQFGTLSGVVRLEDRPNDFFGLTCAHVVLRDEADGFGSSALRWDDSVGEWVRWSAVHDWASKDENANDPIDAALIGPLEAPAEAVQLIPFEPVRVTLLQEVSLHGAFSGKCTSEVERIGKLRLRNPWYRGWKRIQYLDLAFCRPYTGGGDSGSVVMDSAAGRPVGLHFAGSQSTSAFQPIIKVAQEFGFS